MSKLDGKMDAEMMCSRRSLMRGAVVAAAGLGAFSLVGCGASSTSNSEVRPAVGYEPVAVKVLYQSTPENAPLIVAKERGHFEKYGIVAELMPRPRDLKEEFTNSGNYVFLADLECMVQINNGLDAKLISAVSEGCSRVVARTDAKIKGLDLANKKVGVVGKGSTAEVVCKAAMAHEGFDFGQVSWVTLPSIDGVLNAIREGSIEAAALPQAPSFVAEGFLEAQACYDDATDIRCKDVACAFLAGNAAVYYDDELCGRLCTAIQEACEWIQEYSAAACQLIVSSGYFVDLKKLLADWGIYVQDEDLLTTCQRVLSNVTFGDQGSVAFERSLKAQWDTVKAAGMLTGSMTSDELVKKVGLYAL